MQQIKRQRVITKEEFFNQTSRFDAVWKDNHDEQAIKYAKEHSINYFKDQGFNIILPNGDSAFYGNGPIDMAKVRAANKNSNQLDKELHERDTALHTGTSISTYKKYKWHLVTRGPKLRTIVKQRECWTSEKGKATERVNKLREAVVSAKGKELEAAKTALLIANKDLPRYDAIIVLVGQVEKMVLDETEPGWFWKTGLKRQLEVRDRLYATAEDLSEVARESLMKAEKVYGTF